jgi:divalent metal cation (Fe/Co/Zn/Cd) transporter
MATINRTVAKTTGVRDYHAVRARHVGGKVAMDVHIQVDPTLTVAEGHDIASAVQEALRQADCNVIEAVVHIEPAEPGDR